MTDLETLCEITQFYQGKPCKKEGHDGLRYKSTGACVKCMAAYSVAQRLKRLQQPVTQ